MLLDYFAKNANGGNDHFRRWTMLFNWNANYRDGNHPTTECRWATALYPANLVFWWKRSTYSISKNFGRIQKEMHWKGCAYSFAKWVGILYHKLTILPNRRFLKITFKNTSNPINNKRNNRKFKIYTFKKPPKDKLSFFQNIFSLYTIDFEKYSLYI